MPVVAVERKHVLEFRDRFAEMPRKANYMARVSRPLLTFAVDRGRRSDNPAPRPKLSRTGAGHRPWEEHEIAAFRFRRPLGTRERVAFELALNTGQRGRDLAAMVRQQYRDGVIHVRQEKTDARVWIPVSRDLREALEPWLAGHDHMAVLPGERGTGGAPPTVDAFRHIMGEAITAAGLPDDVTTHGPRCTAATVLIEMGCDLDEVRAITNHETVAMARKYTVKKRSARPAVAKLDEARTARKRTVKDGGGTGNAN